MKRKILFITGSRGEYGYIRPVIREIQRRRDMSYELLVTNMHLLEDFGYSVAEIEKDRLKIGSRIFNTLAGYNRETMVKSLGILLQQLPETIERIKPSLIVVAGDRGEQLMAAIVGAHLYIPVAHIQAGEISANIDGTVRHAITKFAHIHFAASAQSARRVLAMGEQKFRIFQTGAPMLDELIGGKVTPKAVLERRYGLSFSRPTLLFAYHPTTEDFDSIESQAREVMAAVNASKLPTIAILPNSDAGSELLREVIFESRTDLVQVFRNVPREDYAGFMKHCALMAGNSSSGIIEAPCFGLPAVNIGRRQEGRESTSNVIHVAPKRAAVLSAIRRALTPAFRATARRASNPYGDGRASGKIVEILRTVPIDEKLLFKKLRY